MDFIKIQSSSKLNSDLSPIQEFYSGAHIFITGSTGLLGSALLEKLLRSCPTISTIYLLLRSKKGKNIETRLEETLNDVLFETLKKENPKIGQKLVGLEGDCALPDLGLSDQDKKLLTDKVNIIFHLAATVRFDEKLKTAVDINVRAPRDLLKVAHQMPQLKSFVHVSTIYSNCVQKVIEEKIYPPSMDYHKLILMVDNVPEHILEEITPRLIGKYPNTYTYTKQIAETIIKTESHGLPIGISRPSIVISTYKEPIPAWINNMYNITGMVAGMSMGVSRVSHADFDCNMNLVPVDMYVNSLIATAWQVGTTFEVSKKNNLPYELPIYSYESSNDMPITLRTFYKLSYQHGHVCPPSKSIWYPFFIFIASRVLCLVALFFLHTIPAIIADGILLCTGKQPRMRKLYTKVNKFSMMFGYFSTTHWTFKNQSAHSLQSKLSAKDKMIFFSDIRQLDWDDYFQKFFIGIRIYVLKDPLETIPKAVRRHKRLYLVHQSVKITIGIFLAWILWTLLAFIF